MSEKRTDIEDISGNINPNILLIAPHGCPEDDKNTGKLARAVQKALGCHAIINEVFRKPENDKNTDKDIEAKIKEKIADLNNTLDAKAHPTFIEKINSKIKGHNNAYVFWIHGIDDKNFANEEKEWKYDGAKCLVGYGQGSKDNDNSMDAEKAKTFISLLNDNGLKTKATNKKSKNYRGASPTNMNQYFRKNGLTNVQSVQLELVNKDVREGKYIKKTGITVAKAIAKLVECETVGIPEDKPDEVLVKETTEKVMEFIATNQKNNVAVGHYLIKQFYDNDYMKAKKGHKVKGASLNAMLDGLQKKGDTPSKSWFYNAVNLAVDDNEFENDTDYAKLNLSHKIHITYLNKDEKWNTHKLGLIKKIAKDGMPIKDLMARIAKIKGKSEPEWPNHEEIKNMNDKEKKKYKERAEKRKNKIQKDMDVLVAELDKCNEIISAVEGTAEQTELKKAA